MSGMFRTSLAVLIVGAAVSGPTVLGPGVAGQGSSRAANDRARFVGAFELVQTEDRDPKTGEWVRTQNFNSNGYIFFGDTGHMAVQIQPKVRPRITSNPPTGEEAQAALGGGM
jgi:hypothetical protein